MESPRLHLDTTHMDVIIDPKIAHHPLHDDAEEYQHQGWSVFESGRGVRHADVVWLETSAHMTNDGRIFCVHSYAEFEEGPNGQVFCTVRRGRQ